MAVKIIIYLSILMLEHFICNSNEKCVIVGIAENDNGNCHMVWSALDDFEK